MQQRALRTDVDAMHAKSALTVSEIDFRIAARTTENNTLRTGGNALIAACATVRENRFPNCARRPERQADIVSPAPKQVAPRQVDCLSRQSTGPWWSEEQLRQPDHQAITADEND